MYRAWGREVSGMLSSPLLFAVACLSLLGGGAIATGATSPTSDSSPIRSGDIVFLWSHQGHTVDVDIGVARARWHLRGGWQGLKIQKADGPGVIASGDAVHIRGHTGDCLQLKSGSEAVGVWPGECPIWQILHADGQSGPIDSGDNIFLKLVSLNRYIDIHGDEDGLLRARWDLTGGWQTLRIEAEARDAIMSGSHVTLATPQGARLDACDKQVRARWSAIGAWRALVLEGNENLGPWSQSFAINGGDGRALYSGDEVTFWATSGKLVEAEDELVQARFGSVGVWQKFIVENEEGGVIRTGHPIFLKAHTGKYVEVHAEDVKAIGDMRTAASALTIATDLDLTKPSIYRQCAVLGVLAFGLLSVLAYELSQPAAEPPKGTAPRLEALDAPRWIASAQIVACHFYEYTWGAAWTQFFFVLSGFVLSYVEMARPALKGGKQVKQLRYVTHRLVTLYPTYIFTIVLAGIQWRHSALDWATLPLHFTLTQAWFPIVYKPLGFEHWEWSGVQWAQVSWFVSVLFIYWLFLRPLTRRIRTWSLVQSCVGLFICWAFSGLWWYIGEVVVKDTLGCTDRSQRCYNILYDYLIYHGWVGMFHVFVSGIFAARIFVLTSMKDAEVGGPVRHDTQRIALDHARAPCLFRFGCVVGYVSFGLLAYFVGREGYHANTILYHNGGILPAMLLVLIGGALGQDPLARYVFQNRLFRILGRISYPQYLIQCNVWGIVEGIFPEDNVVMAPKIVFPFALFVLSYIMERLVTRVGTHWLKPDPNKRKHSSVDKVVSVWENKRRWFNRQSVEAKSLMAIAEPNSSSTIEAAEAPAAALGAAPGAGDAGALSSPTHEGGVVGGEGAGTLGDDVDMSSYDLEAATQRPSARTSLSGSGTSGSRSAFPTPRDAEAGLVSTRSRRSGWALAVSAREGGAPDGVREESVDEVSSDDDDGGGVPPRPLAAARGSPVSSLPPLAPRLGASPGSSLAAASSIPPASAAEATTWRSSEVGHSMSRI